MLNEDETVNIILKANSLRGVVSPANTEVLNISLIDPQNKEFFWEKSFTTATDGKIINSVSKEVGSFSFTPESSGMHHIKINNAGFETDVKLVSGMIMLGEQPYFWKTLFVSCLVAFLGIFLVRGAESKKYARSVTGMISSSISLAISLLIVYNVVFKPM
jgi:hypothetical protein